jgi:hypothetical protein
MASRNVDLYLNVDRPIDAPLLAGRADLTGGENPIFVDGEKPWLRLQFIKPGATPAAVPSVVALGAGDVVSVYAKRKAGDTLLVSATNFVSDGAGDEQRYKALVDFDTTELTAAFGDETTLTLQFEVRVQNAQNTERKSYRLKGTVQKRIYENEGVPTSATPSYPSASSLPQILWGVTSAFGGTSAAMDGQVTASVARPKLYETPAFAWHRWVLRDRDPADVIAVDQTQFDAGKSVIKPLDWNADTNDCVFVMVG